MNRNVLDTDKLAREPWSIFPHCRNARKNCMYPRKPDPRVQEERDHRSETRRYFKKVCTNTVMRRSRLLEIAKRADKKVADKRIATAGSDNLGTVPVSTSANPSKTDAEPHCEKSEPPIFTSVEVAQKGYDWARLDRYAQIIQKFEESKEVVDKKAAQKKLREDLNRQMRDSQRRKQRDQEENVEYSRNVKLEVNQWQDYARRMAEATRLKASLERNDRDEQIRYNQALRKAEIEKRSCEDKELLERITREIQAEEQEKVERKRREREVMHRLMSENEKEQQRKLELKRLSTQAELEQIREYNALIEHQEKERQAELDRRLERQKLLIRKMEENVMKTIQAQADDDNQRALMQQAEREARDLEIEKFKQHNLARMRQEMITTLHEQMKEKDNRKREDADLRDLHAVILKADTKAYEASELGKMRERRDKYRRYRDQLREQIHEARSKRTKEGESMTLEEVRLNSDLIAVVEKILRDESVITDNNRA